MKPHNNIATDGIKSSVNQMGKETSSEKAVLRERPRELSAPSAHLYLASQAEAKMSLSHRKIPVAYQLNYIIIAYAFIALILVTPTLYIAR